jgi:hypothetical protein
VAEGVEFDLAGRIDLGHYRHHPESFDPEFKPGGRP